MTQVGYVATTADRERPYFLTARYDGEISVWDAAELTCVATFPTVFCGVLDRVAMALVGGGPLVFAAALNEGHLAAYDGLSGALVWQRRDIRPVHSVSAIDHLCRLAVTPDRGQMMILDATDGASVTTIRGARRLYASPTGGFAIARSEARTSLVDLDPWRTLRRLDLPGWALLEVAFGPDSFIVSDVNDGHPDAVYGFELRGEPMWRVELPDGLNAPWLGHDSATGEWLGVLHDPEQRSLYRLVRWSADGSQVDSRDIGIAQDYAFVLGGSLLINADRVVDTRSGTVLADLNRPMKG